MNLFNEYKEYFKNNPNGYWFKRKLYGWGWTPVKWQGWLVIFIWVVFFTLAIINMDHEWLKNIIFIIFVIIINKIL